MLPSLTPPPRPLTRFIGREQELAALCALIASHRLVTLTGAGGSGKTRLAAEAAAVAAADRGLEVAWADLAPLDDPDLVAATVLEALDLEQGNRPALQAIADSLRDRATLIVLDNCEHLVDACAQFADTLLQRAAHVRIMATSREALGVPGERAWLVPGLATPDAHATAAEDIGCSEAVRLFVDRAQSALATFSLTAATAPAVARVCRRVDGLPLAIELAAARVRALPPEQLAERLEESLAVLSLGARSAVPRHRTLRATIQWSYDLLDNAERTLLQRLSVFAGDFTLEAAERVATGPGLAASDVLDLLGALVDKSLVNMREEDGTARYYLLETIRQFGREQLDATTDAFDALSRHAATYLALVAEAEPHFITRERPIWVARVARELDNVRLALGWTHTHDPARHVQLAGMLGWFWYSSWLWSEGRRWLTEALALSAANVDPEHRARALLGAGVIASLQADVSAALPLLEECVAICREHGDDSREAYALAYIGVAFGQSGDPAAEAPATQALTWFRQAHDLYGARLALIILSTVHLLRGEVARARAEAEEGVAMARDFGLERELAIALQVLGAVTLAAGDLSAARERFAESLAALRRDPSRFWTARALQLVGLVSCRLGDATVGTTLLGAAEATRESIGAGLLQHDRDRLEPVVTGARATLGDAAFEQEWHRGRTMDSEQAVAFALQHVATTPVVAPPTPRVSQREAAAPPLEVRALGPLEIRVAGQPIPGESGKQGRPRELLLYLLSHPQGRTRDQIGLVFWPDASAMQVKNNFHVALHHLRKTLGNPRLVAFESERYRIAWEGGVWFDARVFEDEVTSALSALAPRGARRHGPRDAGAGGHDAEHLARLQAALALYRGDLLADTGVGDWHLESRDHLRRLYTDALLLIADRQFEEGSYAEAASSYRRVVQAEEFHEEAHRRLMTALGRSGDRAAAMRLFDRLSDHLRRELEAEPEAATRALYDRLRRAEAV